MFLLLNGDDCRSNHVLISGLVDQSGCLGRHVHDLSLVRIEAPDGCRRLFRLTTELL